jgi:hypothetical protein
VYENPFNPTNEYLYTAREKALNPKELEKQRKKAPHEGLLMPEIEKTFAQSFTNYG